MTTLPSTIRASLVIAFLALASHASAAEPRPTRAVVSPSRCEDAAWGGHAYTALVVEELGAMSVPATIENEGAALQATPPGAVWIRLDVSPCSAEARTATLVMTEPLTRARRVREVDLERVALAARPRALALEAAELVRAGWTDAPPTSPAARRVVPEGEPPPPPSPQPRVARDPDRDAAPANVLRIGAAAESRVYPRGGAAFFGGRAGVVGPLASWLLYRVDGGAALGSAKDPLGDVSAGFATAGVGLLALGGARPLSLGVGPRFDLGAAWFSGSASSPAASGTSGSGLVANVAADAMLFARVADSCDLTLEAEGGVAVKSLAATADNRTVIDIGGAFVALRIGAALLP